MALGVLFRFACNFYYGCFVSDGYFATEAKEENREIRDEDGDDVLRKLVFGFLVLFVPFLGGCIRFYGHENFIVNVVDSEDQAPVEYAKVECFYLYAFVINGPERVSSVTDRDGMTEMRLAKFYPRLLRVKAAGYPTIDFDFNKKYWGPNLFKARDKNDILLVLDRKSKTK